MSAPRTRRCRSLRLYATLALVAIGRIPDPASAKAPQAQQARPFRAQDWDLAWQAFVGAGAVNDAYALAQRAVEARPRSHLWLARLAQAARWSNHPEAALAALSRLALDLHARGDLQPALDLAIGLGDDDRAAALLQELIREGRATSAQRRMLSGLYLDAGEPQQALAALQREFTRHPAPQLLWEQVVIYRRLGDPARELAALERYRERFGPGPKVMLAIATLDYVQNRMPQALAALLAARSRVRPSNTIYWQTLSGLAWLLGRYQLSARAASVLIGTGKADAPLYLRVVYVQQYRDPQRAFTVAERGWKQTHEPALFLSMLAIGSSLHPATPWLARAFATLGPGQAAIFDAAPAYWTSLAALRADEGRLHAARAAYRRALRESPGDDNLIADYLWLLLDHHDLAPIVPDLPQLARHARRAPQLWAPLAAVYAALNEPARALPWMQAQWSARKDDPLWLIDYADTLQQADRRDEAWLLRRRAYDLLTAPVADDRSPAGRAFALDRLAIALAPGDPARRAVERLAQQRGQAQSRVTVLAWMQSEHADSLARWWREHAFGRQPPPDWAQLAQAVAESDGPRIARLLERGRSRLASRDQAAAAEDLGWHSLALSRTFEGLEAAPGDVSLQRQYAELSVPRADSLGATLDASETSGLLDEGFTVQASHWLTPQDRLDVLLDTTRQRTLDSTQFGSAPALSRSAALTWGRETPLGKLTFNLGAGRNLAAWSREGFAWQQRWAGTLQTTLGATAGARPLDTAALGVAGLENRLDAGASAQLTPRTALQLQLAAGWLRAQGGGALAAVQRFSLDAGYQLWFTPPDFALDATLSGAHYARAAALPAQLLPLVPAEQAPTVGFFVPRSFVQACAGGHFNMQYATGYTMLLQPYASAELCDNSVSGRGYGLTAGVATPISGPDHLAVTFDLQNDVGTHSGRTAGVMLSYRHYFTPTRVSP
jgi:polysaccharide biosynthesis protein PelB